MMAISSYQTLARYHDGRQSNRMPDIRQQLREDIYSSRSETRLTQLLKNRRLYDTANDCGDEDAYHYDHNYDYDETDYYTGASYDCTSWATPCWQTQLYTHPSNAPSPTLSHDSDYCSSNSSFGPNQCDSLKPIRSTSRRNLTRSRKQILELRKRVQKSCHSLETIRVEYETMKQCIFNAGQRADQEAIGFLFCSSWNALANAMNCQDEHLSRDALNFLTKLIIHSFVKITDVLFIMQQGLILAIKDTISRLGSQQVDVITLLISIVLIEPRATSYIIELITDTDMVRILEDFIEYGTDEEIILATQFYKIIFDAQLVLLQRGDYNPVVPETLSRTTPVSELAKNYDPTLSLQRIMRPNLVSSLISRYFKPYGDAKEELFILATVITKNCLELIQTSLRTSSKYQQWIRSIIGEYEINKFDMLTAKLVQANDRYCSSTVEEIKLLSSLYSQVMIACSADHDC